jgi:DnaJ-class molecular chaperone
MPAQMRPCPECLGRGWIFGDDETVTCPHCSGYGEIVRTEPTLAEMDKDAKERLGKL